MPENYLLFRPPARHFVALDVYCNEAGGYPPGTDADINDYLYNWLVADLQANTQPYIFVFGHEPAYVFPDTDNGRLRHEFTSLNQYPAHRDRFWSLLQAEGVTAYLCGHTHNFSAVNIGGVWQIDAGHARGLGDTGAPSTFVQVQILPGSVRYRGIPRRRRRRCVHLAPQRADGDRERDLFAVICSIDKRRQAGMPDLQTAAGKDTCSATRMRVTHSLTL